MNFTTYLKSFLLFAQLAPIKQHLKAFETLNNITGQDNFNQFSAKTAFNHFQKYEEIIRYGHELTPLQRDKQNQLFQSLSHDNQVHQLFLGRYIRNDGVICAYHAVEIFLFLFGSLITLAAITATSKIVLEVMALPISMGPRLGFTFTIIVIIGVPVYHLLARFLGPSYNYLSIENSIKD